MALAKLQNKKDKAEAKITELTVKFAEEKIHKVTMINNVKIPVIQITKEDEYALSQHLVHGIIQKQCLKLNPKAGEQPYYTTRQISEMIRKVVEHNNLPSKLQISACLQANSFEFIQEYPKRKKQ